MGFAILRTQKLKSPVAVRRSMMHAFREQNTPNANPELTSSNTHFGPQSVAEGLAAFNAILPAKRRKDAVLAIEFLISASPEDMTEKTRAQQDAYFAQALDWLKNKFDVDPDVQSVIYAGIHRDESTPHMYAYVVPVDITGRLNAKRWLGGAKALSQMQTEFAQKVGQHHGLRRGIEHSRAKHTTIREFYGAIDRPEHTQATVSVEQLQPKVLAKRLLSKTLESPEGIAERLTHTMQQHYAPALAKAATVDLERRKAVDATRVAQAKGLALKSAQKRLQQLEPVFEGLTPEQTSELMRVAATHRQANLIDAEKQRRVEALAELVRKAAGAALTFAQHAIAAIKAKAGQWRLVDWHQVEGAATHETVQVNGQSQVSAVKAVLDHSPGQVGTAPERAKAFVEQAMAMDKAKGIKPEPEPPSQRYRGPR